MSDFTNYIRVAIQGLPENSPMARAMAYEKARKAIRRQLEARSAKTGEIDATLDNLENAILDVEAEQSLTTSQKGAAASPSNGGPAPVSAGANVTPFNRRYAKQPAVHGGTPGGAANQALRAEAAGHDALNDFEMALTAVLSESSPGMDFAGQAAAGMLEREDEAAPEEKPASAAPQIDIAALLRRAIGKEDMSDPANREAVYRRARTALDRYLKGLTPAPDYATVHSCIERLNDAIRDTENDLVAQAVTAETVDLNFDAEDLLTELEMGEVSAARKTGAKGVFAVRQCVFGISGQERCDRRRSGRSAPRHDGTGRSRTGCAGRGGAFATCRQIRWAGTAGCHQAAAARRARIR